MSKAATGNFFEDFRLGQELRHATPRTITAGDVALYTGLYGGRFALQSSDAFAKSVGLPSAPVDDLLVFHVVFGKTVPDVSLNAVANLGYAEGRFLAPVYPGDTLASTSEVIGLKENSNKQTGVVYVRTIGSNQHGETVLDYVRWVMVRKRDAAAPIAEEQVPKLATRVPPEQLNAPAGLDLASQDDDLAGSSHRFEDYAVGEKIDHVDGMTVEEAEHMLATRLYQNTARVHFNQFVEGKGRFGRRLVYGGHIISLARGLSFNGLANAPKILAINGGRHANPVFAGNTIHAWSEVLETAALTPRHGAVRLRTLATKDRACGDFPGPDAAGKYPDDVVLDLDYWVLMPRRV
jgi:2-methylfumaryl-CoA hydratase